MNILDWLRRTTARTIVKAAGLPVISPWITESFLNPTFLTLTRDGYQKNSALFACISALSFAFPEPPVLVAQDGEPLPLHPLRQLFTRPNPLMGEAEFMAYLVQYMGIGGNAYAYKVRNGAGRVVELWPYHAGHIIPVPGGDGWITGYDFDRGDGRTTRIPTSDILHFKWPSIDPDQPWMAQPPILAAAREVDTDNEATRYLFALLKNDAIPRTIIEMPPEADITTQEALRMKEQFRERYGGDNRGDVAVLTGGASVKRLGLDLQELAFEALSTIPETRIAAALRVPPIVAGLNAGLQRSTFSNFQEARQAFTQDTLVPLWTLVQSELQANLVPEFDERLTISFDTTQVEALQENEAERRSFLLAEFQAGTMTLNEYRRLRGYTDVATGDVFYLPMSAYVTADPADGALTPVPELPKSLPPVTERKALVLKAVNPTKKRRIEKRIEKRAAEYLQAEYTDAAVWIQENVKAWRANGHSADHGDVLLLLSLVETKALPSWIVELPLDDGDGIAGWIRGYHLDLLQLAYGDAASTLDIDILFDVENEDVQDVLDDLAKLVRQVADTTREDIRGLIGMQVSQGWSIDDLAAEILKLSEIQTPRRARLIARTETARAYSEGSLLGYAESGVVDETEWLVLDPCPICDELDGKRAKLGEEFAPGIRVPGDPHPGCKCALAPVLSEG